MKLIVVMLMCAGLCLTATFPVHGQQKGAVVKNISFRAATDGGEHVEIALSGAVSPQAFMIDGENPRLVIDFPDSRYLGSPSVPAVGATLVQSIRVGMHAAPKRKTRVVVDLAPGKKLSWNRDFVINSNLLILSIMPAEQTAGKSPESSSKPGGETAATSAPEVAGEPASISDAPASGVDMPVSSPVSLGATVFKIMVPPEPAAKAPEKTGAGGKVVPTAEPKAVQPVLLDVTFDNAFSHSGEMVMLKLSDFKPPQISTEEKDPPRIYCDFTGAIIGKNLEREIHAGGKSIEDISITGDAKRLRVTLELASGFNYDLQQVYFKEDNLFVLIVNTRTAGADAAQ